MLGDLLTLVSAGRLDPMLTRTVALDEAPAALTELSGRPVGGKIVCVVRPCSSLSRRARHRILSTSISAGPSRSTPRTWSTDTVSGSNSASHQVAPASA